MAAATSTLTTRSIPISRGEINTTARMTRRLTHTQGDMRRRRDRSILSAAKPSEDVIAARSCTRTEEQRPNAKHDVLGTRKQ